MDKPARLQVDPDTIPDDDKPAKTGDTFNIWYLKWSGGDGLKNYVKLKFKVEINKDSGYTKARGSEPICVFFARGSCYLGKNCKYYHRLPLELDFPIPTQDCFGRDKTAEYRDDMDGVGSFNKHNRTLYLGGLHSGGSNLDQVLTKHLQEYGPIEYIKVLYSKGCAFITFKSESQAQFIKEAMQNQLLDGNEILNIRWANEDPNPAAKLNEKRQLDELTIETINKLIKQTSKKPKKEKVEEVEVKKVLTIEQKKFNFDKDALEKFAFIRNTPKGVPKAKTLAQAVGGYSSDEDE